MYIWLNQDHAKIYICLVWREYIYCLKVYTVGTMSTWITVWPFNKLRQTQNHLNNHWHWYSFIVLQQCERLFAGLAEINLVISLHCYSSKADYLRTWQSSHAYMRAAWSHWPHESLLSLETNIRPNDPFKLRNAATRPRMLDCFPLGPLYYKSIWSFRQKLPLTWQTDSA